MRRTARLLAASAAAALLAGCAGGAAGGSVAASVPGYGDVPTSDLAALMVEVEDQGLLGSEDAPVSMQVDVQRQLLTQLVVVRIFQTAADEAGIEVDEDAVATAASQRPEGGMLADLFGRSQVLRQALETELGADGFQAILTESLVLDVEVDPRFGDWNPSQGVVPAAP